MQKIQEMATWTYMFGPSGSTMLVLAQFLLFLVPAILIYLFLRRYHHHPAPRPRACALV